MSLRRILRRIVRPEFLLGLGAILALTVAALRLIPSRDYVFLPDRARPVAPIVSVQGAHAPKTGGGIYFVDVVIRKASMLEQLIGAPLFVSGADLVDPKAYLYPGETDHDEQQASKTEMVTSQQIAAAVAFHTAGKKVTSIANGIQVVAVDPTFPAQGKLDPDDVIVAVNGKPMRTIADLHAILATKPIGTTFRFVFLRGGERQTASIATALAPRKTPSAPKVGIIGIEPGQSARFKLPVRVTIDAKNVGGPSAGLAFTLQVLEDLGRNVDHGHLVAATGTISLDGTVGPIGGIKQKTYGAREAGVEAFLVPKLNAPDARKYAHGLRIIPVSNFQQALHALATLPSSG